MGPEGFDKNNKPKKVFDRIPLKAALAAALLVGAPGPTKAENSGIKSTDHTITEIKRKKKATAPPISAEGQGKKPSTEAHVGVSVSEKDSLVITLSRREMEEAEEAYESLKNRIEHKKYPHLVFGDPVEPPTGYSELCMRVEEFCKGLKQTTTKRLEFTPQLLAVLVKINKTVNAEIKPASDLETSGTPEYWNPFTQKGSGGDCEDYVWAKFLRLATIPELPIQYLSLTYVLDEKGGGHLVLSVNVLVEGRRTTLGLDNRWNDITLLSDVRYKYKKATLINEDGVKWFDVNIAHQGIAFDEEYE
jgi:predicted transglutaminase-like cysteine proteinase